MKKSKIVQLFIVIAAVTLLFFGMRTRTGAGPATPTPSPVPMGVATIGGVTIPIEIADTDEERDLGLSHRANLPANQGMLFVFGDKRPVSFWMKDMLFPIDIIWVADGKVVQIHEYAMPVPETVEQNLKLYIPNEPVHFALEVNAGFADEHNIKVGDAFEYTHEAP